MAVSARAYFSIAFYITVTLGYLLRWSWGNSEAFLLLFIILTCGTPVFAFELCHPWRRRLLLLMWFGIGIGGSASHLSYSEQHFVFEPIKLLLLLSFVIPLVFLPSLFLMRLPESGAIMDRGPSTAELRWFRLGTLSVFFPTAVIYGIQMRHGPPRGAPPSALHWAVLILSLLVVFLFAAGWIHQLAYHRGWHDGKEGRLNAPTPRVQVFQFIQEIWGRRK